MIWFTSDTHFGHANIIRYCNRPHGSVEVMDADLLDRLNARVQPEDTLYHLGDFCHRRADPAAYRARIRCRKIILIMGNLDPHHADGAPRAEFAALFTQVHSLLQIKVNIGGVSQLIVLCHYAMRTWDRAHHGAWHLYGHSHGSLPDDPDSRSMDVGVDANALNPLSLEDVAECMRRKRFKPIDQHRDSSEESGSAEAPD